MASQTDDLPTEIGRGKFQLAPGFEIEVIQLDNGERLVTEESMATFLEFLDQREPDVDIPKRNAE